MKIPFKQIGVILIFPFLGILVWKFLSTPIPSTNFGSQIESPKVEPVAKKSAFQTIIIGSIAITPDDFQWEQDLLSHSPGLDAYDEHASAAENQAVPAEGAGSIIATSELQEQIVTAVIERKILYQYIGSPALSFDLSNPALFTKCLETLNETLNETTASGRPYFTSAQDKNRLKAKLCEQSVIDQYLDQQILTPLNIAPSEIALYYRLHEKEFNKPMRMVFRQIVFANEAKALTVRREIKKSNFSQLAIQHSIAPEASKGGLVGPFSRNQLPTLFDSAYTMEIGEITGIIKSDYGFHIIMPIERIPAQILSLTAATPVIRAEILRTKRLALYQNFLHKAMNAISVTSPNPGVF